MVWYGGARAGGLAVTQNRTYESMQVNATNRTCLHCTSKTQVSTHVSICMEMENDIDLHGRCIDANTS